MSDADVRAKLKAMLLEKSYRKGKFTLTSGRESDFYFDCKPTALDPLGGLLIAREFFRIISEKFPRAGAVAGMTLGGDPLVVATSLTSLLLGKPLTALIIRKEAKKHGTQSFIEGRENVSEGTFVVVIDDVSTTAGTMLSSIRRVRETGLRVNGVIAVVDRQEGAAETLQKETGFELYSIFTKEQLLAQEE